MGTLVSNMANPFIECYGELDVTLHSVTRLGNSREGMPLFPEKERGFAGVGAAAFQRWSNPARRVAKRDFGC